MSLVREIQEAAIASGTGIAALLRRCQVLAYRIDHKELKQWVQHELNGYPEDEPLPSYRRMPLSLTGTFIGPFGASLRGVPIVPAALPPALVELVRSHPLRAPIVEYETLAEGGRDLEIRLSGDALFMIGHNVYQEVYRCVEARHAMASARLRGLVDSVRNRVLSFALELGKLGIEPLNDDSGLDRNIPREAVSHVFHTQIVGDNVAVAIGENAQAQAVQAIVPKDLESLSKFLSARGIDESDLADLKQALEADPVPASKKALGERVSGWLGRMATKAAKGVWKAGLEVGTKVLSTAILKYYGLD